tara:strand:- start:13010 stop:13282 length:273 start_codon:yes stop_codon:yes gene_type:complete
MNEPYVTIEDVAKHFSVSISTVRGWIRQKYIPEDTYISINNVLRFRISDVTSALVKVKSEDSKIDTSMDTVLVKKESEQPDFFEALDENI